MEANKLLEESLSRFDEKFRVLGPKFVSEFRQLGDVIASCELQAEPFVDSLLKFADAVVAVRKNVALRDLPVPPYDLWLPFKAEQVYPCDPAVLEDAKEIFHEKMRGLASLWRVMLDSQPTPTPRPSDPALARLRDQIVSLTDKCNRRCSGHPSIKSPLFRAPSETSVWNDLNTREIPTYVTSETEFDKLVMDLNVALDESLRPDVRKLDIAPPPGPLARVKELLHNGDFRHLGTLRNKPAHGLDQSKVGLIYQKLIGKTFIDRDDVASWQQLQKALLEMLVDALKGVRDCFEPTAAEASDSAAVGRR